MLTPMLVMAAGLVSLTSAFAQTDDEHFYVELNAPTREIRSEIAQFIHIDRVTDDHVSAVVNKFDMAQLEKNFPELLISREKIVTSQNGGMSTDFPDPDSAYHTYSEVVSDLQALNKKYPEQTELFVLGKTVEGKNIQGIRIFPKKTMQENQDQFVPGILFVGSHHAREHLSTEVPLNLAKYLLDQQATSDEIKNLLQNRDIYIIPVLNVDGSEFDIQDKHYKMWRKNRLNNSDGTYGVDLNRNYGFGWGTGGSSRATNSDVYMGSKPFSEPETTAFKNFVESKANIRIILSFHTYSELILYPWGHKYEGIGGKDEQVFTKMAQDMAKWNKYTPEQSSALYIASGDTCDWAYGSHGIFCFTFELSPKDSWLGGGFYPGPQMISKAFNDNIKPALYLINKAEGPYSVLE